MVRSWSDRFCASQAEQKHLNSENLSTCNLATKFNSWYGIELMSFGSFGAIKGVRTNNFISRHTSSRDRCHWTGLACDTRKLSVLPRQDCLRLLERLYSRLVHRAHAVQAALLLRLPGQVSCFLCLRVTGNSAARKFCRCSDFFLGYIVTPLNRNEMDSIKGVLLPRIQIFSLSFYKRTMQIWPFLPHRELKRYADHRHPGQGLSFSSPSPFTRGRIPLDQRPRVHGHDPACKSHYPAA